MQKIYKSTLYKGKLYFRCNGKGIYIYIYKYIYMYIRFLGELKLTFCRLLQHLARCNFKIHKIKMNPTNFYRPTFVFSKDPSTTFSHYNFWTHYYRKTEH